MTYTRNCPKCDKVLSYTDGANYRRAVRRNSLCNKCTVRNTPEVISKISKSLKGRKYPSRASNTKAGKIMTHFRECPSCQKQIGYASEYARNRAVRLNAVCNSCSCKIYKKSWTHVIKDDHIKQMAATKAGYNTYEEYMADLDNRKKYYREVRKITRQQDISVLENYDKLRGLCGVDGAYQLDHIIPVSTAYEKKLPAKDIGHISNLQIIPWKDNLLKSNG